MLLSNNWCYKWRFFVVPKYYHFNVKFESFVLCTGNYSKNERRINLRDSGFIKQKTKFETALKTIDRAVKKSEL